MVYVLLSFTVLSSAAALWFWFKLFEARPKLFKHGVDLADLPADQHPVPFLGMLLPSRLRRIWNAMGVAFILLVLGFPHFVILWGIWRGVEPNAYGHYALTLICWLSALALPAGVVSKHQRAERERAASVPIT